MQKLFITLCFLLSLLMTKNATAQSNAEFDYYVSDTTNKYTFINLSTFNGQYATYNWDFGDGKTGTGYQAQHTYTNKGTYKVCLIINAFIPASTDTTCKIIVANKINPCKIFLDYFQMDTNPLKAVFTAGNTCNSYSNQFKWVLPASANNNQLSYTFSSKGTYKLQVQVKDSLNHCVDTLRKTINIKDCAANFFYTTNYQTKTVSFTDYSSTTMTNYSWDFGDGQKSTTKSPAHTYSNFGTYKVTLIALGSSSKCADTMIKYVSINCESNFYLWNTDTILSYYTSKPGATKLRWNFGDGGTAKDSSGSHTYFKAGTYNVCLTVTYKTDSCKSCIKFKAYSNSYCKSSFTSKAVGAYGVQFSDKSKGTPTSWWWNFGDGKGYSSIKNPFYSYTKPGKYWVTLMVWDSTKNCSDSSGSHQISAGICDGDFTITPDPKNNLICLSKSPFKYNGVNKHEWIIDGKKSSSNRDTMNILFSTWGSHTICHVYRDSTINCSDSVCKNIVVYPPCDSTFAYGVSGDTIHVGYTGMNGTNIKWVMSDSINQFADSGKSTFHSFKKYGTFEVCMFVKCPNSIVTRVCKKITVTPKCKSDYTFKTDSVNSYKIKFTNKSTTQNAKYKWNFGNGDSSISANPTYTYSTYKDYNVCLVSTDSVTGCKDTKCSKVAVGKPRCDSTINNYVRGDSLYFNYSGSATNVVWKFGDGDSSINKTGYHVYSKSGNYTVTLLAICSSGYSSKNSATVTIQPKCKALFKLALDTTQKFKLFLLNKSSNTSSTHYFWDFGDGSYSGLRNPSHKYAKFGKYAVCLTVLDTAINCSHQWCDTFGLDSSGKFMKAFAWELIVIEDIPGGIKKVVKSDFKIYPNPANTKVTLDLSNSTRHYDKIEIINGNGQVCILQPIETGIETIEVNLERITNGLYLIKLSNDQGYSCMKLMKN